MRLQTDEGSDVLEGYADVSLDPERLGEREQDDDVETELQIAVGSHSNHSGFSIATTR